MNHLLNLFEYIMNFDNSQIRAIDRCHNLFLIGAILSKKPTQVIELGMGTGYVTWSILHALKYNQKGKLTCIDSWFDWEGKKPNGVQAIIDAGAEVVAPVTEEEFVRNCPTDACDILISDADHHHSHSWVDQHIRITKPGGFMFFHDTNNQAMFPNLTEIEGIIKKARLPSFHFTENSREDEHCDRGWLFVMNTEMGG